MSKPVGVQLTKELTSEYEKLVGLGFGDKVIHEKLEAMYSAFLSKTTAELTKEAPNVNAVNPSVEPVAPTTENVATVSALASSVASGAEISRTQPKKNHGLATPTPVSDAPAAGAPVGLGRGRSKAKVGLQKGNSTRRKSFEAPIATPAAPSMVGSASTSALPAAEGAGVAESSPVTALTPAPVTAAVANPSVGDLSMQDNWDSVSQMPFCETCKMAFKTPGLLDRHVKYSELHAKALKKQIEDAEKAPQMLSIAESPEVTVRKAIEGEDYTLIYFGSKFFWRTQDNVDLSFFRHHRLTDTLEVVPFDVYKNAELPRIYLDMCKLKELIQPELAAAREAEVTARKATKFTQEKINEENLLRRVLTTAVLARLNLQEATASGAQVPGAHVTVSGAKSPKSVPVVAVRSRAIVFGLASTDVPTHNPVLTCAPSGLVPVCVAHRRNTTTEEISAKLADLEQSKRELTQATQRAEKVVTHVQSFAKNMKAEFLAMSKMTMPRKRWIMAINRVMQINGVQTTKAILEKIATKNAGLDRRRGPTKSLG